MSVNANQEETTVTTSSEATSSAMQTLSATQVTQSAASTSSIHHSNRYGSYSTHNQPVYTGPVYNIEKAEFTGAPSPPLFPPPSTAASPPTSPAGTSQIATLSSPGMTSNASSSLALAGRWVYVPEGENQATPQRPERSKPGDDEESDYHVELHPDVVQTSKDFEEELKLAFTGFLSKEHRPWKPSEGEREREGS